MKSFILVALCVVVFMLQGHSQDSLALREAIEKIMYASSDETSVGRAIEFAKAANKKGDVVNATIIAEKGIEFAKAKHDRLVDLYEIRGRAFLKNSQPDLALKDFESALAEEIDLATQPGRRSKSADLLKRAWLNLYRGYALDSKGSFDEALRVYNIAQETYDEADTIDEAFIPYADNAVGLANLHAGKFKEAYEYAKNSADEMKSSDINAYVFALENLANIKLKEYYKKFPGGNAESDLLKDASTLMREATTIMDNKSFPPKDEHELMLTVAEIEMETGNLDAAKRTLSRVKSFGADKLSPERRNAFVMLNGRYLFLTGHRSNAEAAFRSAIIDSRSNGNLEAIEAMTFGTLWYLQRSKSPKATDLADSLTAQVDLERVTSLGEANKQYVELREILLKSIKGLHPHPPSSSGWLLYIPFILGLFSAGMLAVKAMTIKSDSKLLTRLVIIVVVLILLTGLFLVISPAARNSPLEIGLFGQTIRTDNVGVACIFMAVALAYGTFKIVNGNNADKKTKGDKGNGRGGSSGNETGDDSGSGTSKPGGGQSLNPDQVTKIDEMIKAYYDELIITTDVIRREEIKKRIAQLEGDRKRVK